MSTLVASYHHPVQAINKSAQIREAYMQGCTTVQAVQNWLKPKGVQCKDALVIQVLNKAQNKKLGPSAVYGRFSKYSAELLKLLNTTALNLGDKETVARNFCFMTIQAVLAVTTNMKQVVKEKENLVKKYPSEKWAKESLERAEEDFLVWRCRLKAIGKVIVDSHLL